jgi:uncharacterized protein (TIGR01777 family)
MSNILITGGSGLIGSQISDLLISSGYNVGHLTRSPEKKSASAKMFGWNIDRQEIDQEAIPWADHIIQLAGETVGQLWTESKKKKILDSRIASISLINKELSKGSKVKSIISASGIGYYGDDTGSNVLTEDSPKGSGFLSDVVNQWEAVADEAKSYVDKVVKIRIGIVLSADGGALEKMIMPIKWRVGSSFGSGKQWMSWIHITDLSRIFLEAIKNPVPPIINGVSPNPVTNEEFTKILAKKLHRHLILPAVPKFALRMLLGEMSILALGSNKVIPASFQKEGFTFEYKTLPEALDSII